MAGEIFVAKEETSLEIKTIVDANGNALSSLSTNLAAANTNIATINTNVASVLANMYAKNLLVYNTPGTYSWTVPNGVREVLLTAVGGGGGGQDNNSSAWTAGGVTSFGSKVSLSGGSHTSGATSYIGTGATDELGGGTGAMGGVPFFRSGSGGSGSSVYTSNCRGGASSIGAGGVSGVSSPGYGGGGGGRNSSSYPGSGGGGGAGVVDLLVPVIPGEVIAIVVGAAGTGTSDYSGGTGYLHIVY
ncbi:hypothetical protein Q5O14_18005 [Eubacteriaceae bacterium ES2]|nr:hypothetical protein Q5O14_18005 [Eubacteriaceae bacterium ES2]